MLAYESCKAHQQYMLQRLERVRIADAAQEADEKSKRKGSLIAAIKNVLSGVMTQPQAATERIGTVRPVTNE